MAVLRMVRLVGAVRKLVHLLLGIIALCPSIDVLLDQLVRIPMVRRTTLYPVFVVQVDARPPLVTIAPRHSIYVLLGHRVRIQMVWWLILGQDALVDQYHVQHQLV